MNVIGLLILLPLGTIILAALGGRKPKAPKILLNYHATADELAPVGWYWKRSGGEASQFPVGWHGPFDSEAAAIAAARRSGAQNQGR